MTIPRRAVPVVCLLAAGVACFFAKWNCFGAGQEGQRGPGGETAQFGDVVLLDFTAPWCGPCRLMAPTVERLIADGYPVRKVNIDREQRLVSRFGVRNIPCFVLVSQGAEVDRISGPASYARLQRMIEKVRPAKQRFPRTKIRGQSPPASPSANANTTPPPDPFGSSGSSMPTLTMPSTDFAVPATSPAKDQATTKGDPTQQAYNATVLLTIADGQGLSHGTGTIIDVHRDEALVLTCGHIFRDSGGQGRISAQLFAPGAPAQLAAELIDYDARYRDVGLVSVHLNGFDVTPVRVAPPTFRPQMEQSVFSIGCDRGGPAQVRTTRITGLNRYIGAPNIEAAGAPAVGRSGGGLFSADGLLIGVCNAADRQDNEGLYAALPSVYWQLDKVGQSRLYAADGEQIAGGSNLAVPAANRNDAIAPGATGQAELICIMHSPKDPHGKTEVIVIDRVSAELLQRIRSEQQRRGMAGQLSQGRESIAAPVYRGQSRR